jgi:hypothetical protein
MFKKTCSSPAWRDARLTVTAGADMHQTCILVHMRTTISIDDGCSVVPPR